jgi:hypothetical protein
MSVRKVGDFEFRRKSKQLIALKSTLPIVLANLAVNHFKEGFKKGGGQTDASSGGWKARAANSKRNLGRAILVDTGALRRDIRKGKVSFTYTEIMAGNTPKTNKYAYVNNQGIGRMPKREFIGKSKVLSNAIDRKILLAVKKALN